MRHTVGVHLRQKVERPCEVVLLDAVLVIAIGTLYAGLRGTNTKITIGQIVSDATVFGK